MEIYSFVYVTNNYEGCSSRINNVWDKGVRGERGIQGSYTISDFIYFEVIINYEVTKLIFRKYLFGLHRRPLPGQSIWAETGQVKSWYIHM